MTLRTALLRTVIAPQETRRGTGNLAAVGATFVLAALAPVLAVALPTTKETWEEKALREAEAALGGGMFDFERLGAPARALREAERIVRRGDPAYRVRAALLEARAAASGGDYRRARSALSGLQGDALSPEQREFAETAEAVWRCLALLAPDGTEPESLHQPRKQCTLELSKSSKPSSELAASLRARGIAVLRQSDTPRIVADGLLDAGAKRLIEFSMPSAMTMGCGPNSICALGRVFQARLLIAAHEPVTARRIIDEALAEPIGDDSQLGLMQMAKGDLLIAPEGSPESLGLPLSTGPFDRARTAGLMLKRADRPTTADLSDARSLYQTSARWFRLKDCSRCLVDLEVREAFIRLLEGRYSEARKGFEEARQKFVELGDYTASARLDFPRLALAFLVDDSNAVQRLVREATLELKAADCAARAAALVTWLLQFSLQQRQLGNVACALAVNRAARDLALAIAPDAVRRDALGQHAALLSDLGLRRQAVPDLRLLLDLSASEPRQRLLAASSLMTAYIALEESDNAREMLEIICPDCKSPDVLMAAHRYRDVLAIAREKGDRFYEAMARVAMNDLSEAVPLIEAEAQSLLARLEQKSKASLDDLDSLLPSGNYPGMSTIKSLRKLQLPDSAIETLVSTALKGQIRSVLLLALKAQQYKIASKLLRGADKRFPAGVLADSERPWLEQGARASLADGLGDLLAARELGDRAVALIDRTTTLGWSNNAEENLRDDVGYIFADATRVRIEQALAGQITPAEALLYLENWRARRFHARLQRSVLAGTGPHATAARWLHQLAGIEVEVAALHREVSRAKAQKTDAHNRARLTELESRRLGLAVEGFSGEDKGLDPATFFSRLRPQSERDSTTRFITYFIDRDLVVAWVLDEHQAVKLRRLSSTSSELRQMVLELRNAIQQNVLQPSDDGWRSKARTLYGKLIDPLEDLLPAPESGARLGIVPFGSLHGLPFQVLLHGDIPLIQKFPLFYPPSLRAYPTIRDLARSRKDQGPTRIVSFGFNGKQLGDAEREAVALAIGRDAHHGIGANRRAFELAAATGSILHIAAHAEYDPSDPFASNISLHGGPITIFDFSTMDLHARLLTLSACDTGRSEITRGEDLNGISWAILAAGVPSVVVAGWRVNDKLSLPVMRTFYSELKQGRSAAVALADAQRSVAAKSNQSAAWAVFSLMGAD